MADLISRQDAIDAVYDIVGYLDWEARGEVSYVLSGLPSEQPERILEEAKAEIKKEIKDLKEAQKNHADFVPDNGDFVIMGLMAALKILERCENELV